MTRKQNAMVDRSYKKVVDIKKTFIKNIVMKDIIYAIENKYSEEAASKNIVFQILINDIYGDMYDKTPDDSYLGQKRRGL